MTWRRRCLRTVDEFELIARHLAPLTAGVPGASGLANDAAVLRVEKGFDLVVTKDMMAEGVHFLPGDPPDLIARKLLRVNLSDLASMGAEPIGYLVGAGLTAAIDEDWLVRFVGGLADDQAEFGVGLLGGDTIGLGDGIQVWSLTALGKVEQDKALPRSGARPGDLLAVSGELGDSALGLKCLRAEIDVPRQDRERFIDRYRLPRPRIGLGRRLVGLASAALDVSDGLVADAGHLALQSGLAVEIEAGRLPRSPAARRLLALTPEHLTSVLTGGDDYELLFSIAERDFPRLADADVPVTVIGRCLPGAGVTVRDEAGRDITPAIKGWRHPVAGH